MAREDSKGDRALADFFARGPQFNFFQAVKTVEAFVRFGRRRRGEYDVVPPGTTMEPDEEALRFSSQVSLAFPPSDIAGIRLRPRDGGKPVIDVTMMGLAGARGPLPDWFVELIRDRVRLRDTALRDFLDIFNHRLVSLLYRVRQHHRPTLNTGPVMEHPVANMVASFCGLGSPAAQQALAEAHLEGGLPKHNASVRDMLFYAGILWNRDRSMLGLERLLSHYFAVPVRGAELAGRWIPLAEDARTALSTGLRNNRLGVSAATGGRVWDPQAGFELALGPMSWEDFVDFLPTGGRFVSLVYVTRFYVRSAFDFYVQLSVRAEEATRGRPGLSARPGGPRLGWTSWLLTRGFEGAPLTVRLPGRTQIEAEAAAQAAAGAEAS